MQALSSIEKKRIEDIGGIENAEVKRILDNFVSELSGYLFLLDELRAQKDGHALLETLHKLKGSSITCGFTRISQAVIQWEKAPEPFRKKLHSHLKTAVEASALEWQHFRTQTAMG